MNFSFLKKCKVEDKTGLIFNIGGTSVSAVVVNFIPNSSPKILYAVRIPYKFKQLSHHEMMRDSLKATLHSVCDKIESEGLATLSSLPEGERKIDSIHFVLSSVWCVTQTKVFYFEKKVNFSPAEEIQKKLAEKTDIDDSDEEGIPANGQKKMRFIERSIARILLNGYEVSDPYSKQARKASVYLFESATSKDIVKIVKGEIFKRFHTSKVVFHSFPYVLHSVLKETFTQEKNYLMVDIGSETTEVMFVRDGVLMETVSFPIGKNYIIRKAPKEFGDTPEALADLFSINKDKSTDVDFRNRTDLFLSKIKTEWLEAFNSAVQNFSHTMYLPKTVFLICDEKYETVFSDWIKEIKYSSFYRCPEPFSVTLIKDKSFGTIYNVEKPEIAGEQFLALESIFINSLVNKNK